MIQDEKNVVEATIIDSHTTESESVLLQRKLCEQAVIQTKLQKQKLFWTRICCGFVALIFLLFTFIIGGLYMQITSLIQGVEDTRVQLTELMSQISVIVTVVEEAEFDTKIETMVEDISSMMEDVGEVLAESGEKIGTFDVEALNEAIDSLSRAVSPLANLFG